MVETKVWICKKCHKEIPPYRNSCPEHYGVPLIAVQKDLSKEVSHAPGEKGVNAGNTGTPA